MDKQKKKILCSKIFSSLHDLKNGVITLNQYRDIENSVNLDLNGSLEIKAGDRVFAGQRIAKVGNSGNTTEPHLHIHAVRKNTGDHLFTGKGVPITFDGHFFVRNTFASVSNQGDMQLLGFFNFASEIIK